MLLMKRLFFLFIIGICCRVSAEYTYTIKVRSHLFSTQYDLYADEQLIAKVDQSALETYSLFDSYGREQAIGKVHLVSIGTVFKSLKTIDVSDSKGNLIGWIKGDWRTLKDGKFLFYDSQSDRIATAYVDQKRKKVSIVDPSNKENLFVLFRFASIAKKSRWEIDVIQEEAIPPEMLYIFSAFITHVYK
ncbi:MAG: hypothetical protein K1000chlam2_01452 [Chlamydiae bacterium]|nr:hypothetical protein [Chlamydiota bacterium]